MRIEHISKTYHNKANTVEALHDVSITFPDHGLVFITGPSGCGKTTLLNIIANVDHQYTGSVIDPIDNAYLTQEVQLFESNTVLENLLFIRPNKRSLVKRYINDYNLSSVANKKVKKCSIGQKKRVQIIAALLQNKPLLLLDEPSASLDHDNAIFIMEKLKEISLNQLVIVVSHDLDLAKKYASVVIEIEKGVIKNTFVQSDNNETIYRHKNKKLKTKSILENLKLTLICFKGRLLRYALLIVIFTLCSSLLYIGINIYYSSTTQLDFQQSVINGNSLLVPYNKEYKKRNEPPITENGIIQTMMHNIATPSYLSVQYDTYTQDDLINIATIEGVLAIEPVAYTNEYFINSIDFTKNYLTESSPYKYMDAVDLGFNQQYIDESGLTLEELEYKHSIDQISLVPINYPFVAPQPYPLVENGVLSSEDIIISMEWFNDYVRGNALHAFYMVGNINQIPLLYGSYPVNSNEIVIDQNSAELIAQINQIDSIDQLVGTTLDLQVLNQLAVRKNSNITLQSGYVFDYYTYTISGISSLQNDSYRMIYLSEPLDNKTMIDTYASNSNELTYMTLRILLSPNADSNKVVQLINETLESNNTTIVPLSQIDENNLLLNNDTSTILISMIAIVGLTILFIAIIFMFMRKTMRKERYLIKTYGYSYIQYTISNTLLLVVIPLVMTILINQLGITTINQYLRVNSYAFTIQANSLLSLLPPLILFVSIVILQGLITSNYDQIRKHQ